MKHKGDTDITSSIHIFIIYSKTSINSTALSMLDHKANDHSYSHRALFVSFTYLPIFEIRQHTRLPEYTVRENDNYFVMHSSSLHQHGRYLPVSPHLIHSGFRSIDLKFYHPSCVLRIITSCPFVHWQCQNIFWTAVQSGKRALIFDRKYTHLHLYLSACTLSLLRKINTLGKVKVHHFQPEFKD